MVLTSNPFLMRKFLDLSFNYHSFLCGVHTSSIAVNEMTIHNLQTISTGLYGELFVAVGLQEFVG